MSNIRQRLMSQHTLLHIPFQSGLLPSGLVAQYPKSYTIPSLNSAIPKTLGSTLTALLFASLTSFESASRGDLFSIVKKRS